MKIRTGHHYSFSVRDLEQSRSFYSEILGLEEIDRPNLSVRGTWYQAGHTEVHLIEIPDGVDTGSPPAALTTAANHSAFQIEDFDEAVATLEAAGIEFIQRRGERKQIFLRDPDGNIIELIHVD